MKKDRATSKGRNTSKGKNTTKGRSKSKDRSKSKKRSNSKDQERLILSQEDIDKLYDQVELKKPGSAYNLWWADQYEKKKSKYKGAPKEIVQQLNEEIKGVWTKLSKKEKEPWEQQHNELKDKYERDLEIVKNLLVQDFDECGATAYRLFLNNRIKHATLENEDIKEAKKTAKEDWENMDPEGKQVWKDIKAENDEVSQLLRNGMKISGWTLFVKRQFKEAKRSKVKPTFVEIGEKWNALSEDEKNPLEERAEEIKEMARKAKDVYDLSRGIKPQRPISAKAFYLKHLSENGKLKGHGNEIFTYASQEYDKLKDDEKKPFEQMAKRQRIQYEYKSMVYQKNRKQKLENQRAPSARNLFAVDFAHSKEWKKEKAKEGDKKNFLKAANEAFNALPEKKKNEYIQKAAEEKEQFDKQYNRYDDKVFDAPPRPRTGRGLYMSGRIKEILEEDKNKTNPQAMAEASADWKALDDKEKEKWNQQADKEKALFKKQEKEFKEHGYFTPEPGQDLGSKKPGLKSQRTSRSQSRMEDEEDEKDDKAVNKRGKSKGKAKDTTKGQSTSKPKSQKRKPSKSKGKDKGKKK